MRAKRRKTLWYQNIQDEGMPITKLKSIDDVSEIEEGNIIYEFEDGTKCYEQFVLNHEDINLFSGDWLNRYKMVGIVSPKLRYREHITKPDNCSNIQIKNVDGDSHYIVGPDVIYNIDGTVKFRESAKRIESDWEFDIRKLKNRTLIDSRELYKISNSKESIEFPYYDVYIEITERLRPDEKQPTFISILHKNKLTDSEEIANFLNQITKERSWEKY